MALATGVNFIRILLHNLHSLRPLQTDLKTLTYFAEVSSSKQMGL